MRASPPHRYLWSGLIVVLGIYLNVYSKRNKLTFADCLSRLRIALRLRRGASGQRADSKRHLLQV